jgi:hypothetical protein
MSLCAYCGAPLGTASGSAAGAATDPNIARLAKMSEHPTFQASMAWSPPECEALQRAERTRALVPWAIGAAVLGLLAIGFGAVASLAAWLLGAACLALAAFAVRAWIEGGRVRRKHLALPLMKRPAIVQDRRSETALGLSSGQTVYFFQLAFADGSEGEFRFPGRGVSYEPMAVGATGLAYTRGTDLLAFKTLRV